MTIAASSPTRALARPREGASHEFKSARRSGRRTRAPARVAFLAVLAALAVPRRRARSPTSATRVARAPELQLNGKRGAQRIRTSFVTAVIMAIDLVVDVLSKVLGIDRLSHRIAGRDLRSASMAGPTAWRSSCTTTQRPRRDRPGGRGHRLRRNPELGDRSSSTRFKTTGTPTRTISPYLAGRRSGPPRRQQRGPSRRDGPRRHRPQERHARRLVDRLRVGDHDAVGLGGLVRHQASRRGDDGAGRPVGGDRALVLCGVYRLDGRRRRSTRSSSSLPRTTPSIHRTVARSSDADCYTSAAGPIRDPAKHLCGLCVESDTSHCPAAMPACDLSSSSNQCTGPATGTTARARRTRACRPPFPPARRRARASTCNGDYQSTGSIDCAVGAPCRSPTGHCCLCTTNADPQDDQRPPVSPYCNSTKGACVSACASDVDCGSGNVCDAKDGKCGYANGDGPCTAATAADVCRSGACGAISNVCVPAGGEGCAADADCSAGNYCDGSAFMCTPTLANGQSIPSDGLHDGACTAAAGEAVCAAGVCDGDGRCGLANGHSVCKTGAQCRSSLCDAASGVCTPCNGDADSSASHRCPSNLAPYCSADGLCTAMKAASSQTVPAGSSGGCVAAGGTSSMADLAGLGAAIALVAARIRRGAATRKRRSSRD